MRFFTTRPGAIVAAVLVALVLISLWPSLIGGKIFSSGDNILLWPPFSGGRPAGWTHPSNFNLTDPVLGFLPDLLVTRHDLAHGIAPLWNPYAGAGRPLLASQVHAPLFPVTWLAFLLPFWSALAWIAAAKLLLAGAGTYLFCRELKLRRGPALVGAIAYPFGTFFIAWLEHPQTNVWAMLPWMLFAARRVCMRGSLGATALLGGATGLVWLGGHPESAAFLLGTTAAYAAFELIAERTRGQASGRSAAGPHWTEPIAGRAGLIAAGLILGVGVGAIVSVPLFELLGQSPKVERGGPGAPFQEMWAFFFPELWGNPSKAFTAGAANFNERTAYFGVLPLLLSVASLGRRRPREQWFFVALAVVVLATIFNTPLWASGVRDLPEGKVAQLTRLLVLVSFAGAVLAAYGLQRWLGGDDGKAELRGDRGRLIGTCVVDHGRAVDRIAGKLPCNVGQCRCSTVGGQNCMDARRAHPGCEWLVRSGRIGALDQHNALVAQCESERTRRQRAPREALEQGVIGPARPARPEVQ